MGLTYGSAGVQNPSFTRRPQTGTSARGRRDTDAGGKNRGDAAGGPGSRGRRPDHAHNRALYGLTLLCYFWNSHLDAESGHKTDSVGISGEHGIQPGRQGSPSPTAYDPVEFRYEVFEPVERSARV